MEWIKEHSSDFTILVVHRIHLASTPAFVIRPGASFVAQFGTRSWCCMTTTSAEKADAERLVKSITHACLLFSRMEKGPARHIKTGCQDVVSRGC